MLWHQTRLYPPMIAELRTTWARDTHNEATTILYNENNNVTTHLTGKWLENSIIQTQHLYCCNLLLPWTFKTWILFIQNIDHSPWRHGDDRSKRNPTVRLYRINIDIRISRCAMINPNQSLWSEEEWSGYYVSW